MSMYGTDKSLYRPRNSVYDINTGMEYGQISKVEDADTFYIGRQGYRFAGIDAPETAHKDVKTESRADKNFLARYNKDRDQAFGQQARARADQLIAESGPIYIRETGKDVSGRTVAEVYLSDGRSLNQTLLREGLATPYIGELMNPRVLDRETRAEVLRKVRNREGIYSDPLYIDPKKYRDGVLELPGQSLRELEQGLVALEQGDRVRDIGYTHTTLTQANTTLSNEFSDQGILIASRLPASYFYGRALHNQDMRRSGLLTHTVSTDDIGIAQTMYQTAYAIKHGKVAEDIPSVFERYDRELSTPGLGAYLNEFIFMPMGLGRLYKDELGFIPSVAAAIGSTLDDALLSSVGGFRQTINRLDHKDQFYQQEGTKNGFFERTFGFAATFGINTITAVGLYLAVNEPINLILGESLKSNIEAGIDIALGDSAPFKSKIASTYRMAIFGTSGTVQDAPTYKASMIMSNQDESLFGLSRLGLSPYNYANIARQRAKVLAEEIIKPFFMDVINPYTAGKDSSFIDTINNLVEEIGRPIEVSVSYEGVPKGQVDEFFNKIRAFERKKQTEFDAIEMVMDNSYNQGKSVDDYPRLMESLSKTRARYSRENIIANALKDGASNEFASEGLESNPDMADILSSVRLRVVNAGKDRQQAYARVVQEVLDITPINPFRWGLFSKTDTPTYKAIGDFFSFQDLSNKVNNIIYGRGGLSGLLIEYQDLVDGNLPEDRALREQFNQQASKINSRINNTLRLLTEAPSKVFQHLSQRRDIIRSLDKASKTWNKLEIEILKQQDAFREAGHQVTLISMADDTKSSAILEQMRRLRQEGEERALRLGTIRGTTEYNLLVEEYISKNVDRQLDPFSREIYITKGTISYYDDAIEAAAEASQSLNPRIVSEVQERHREMALGVMSMMTKKNLTKRLASNVQSMSSLGGSKLARVGLGILAGSIFLNNLFQSSSGVSLFTQVQAALTAGGMNRERKDLGFNVDFQGGGALLPYLGIGPMALQSALVTTGVTYGQFQLARWIGQSMRGVEFVTDLQREESFREVLTNTRHRAQAKINDEFVDLTVDMLDDLADSVSDIRLLTGRGQISYTRQVVDGVATYKGLTAKTRGNAGLITSTAFIALSLGGMAANKLVANTLTASRDLSGSLDPLVGGLLGGVIGARVGRGGGMLLGALLGGIGTATINNMFNLRFLNVGKPGAVVDPIQGQLALGLQNYRARVFQDRDRASNIELMGAVYAGELSKMMSIFQNKGPGKITRVIAQQAPLPAIQFFFTSTTKSNNNTYFTAGIQGSPMTGMSFSLQLPVKVFAKENGSIGLAYNEENNLLSISQSASDLLAASLMTTATVKGIHTVGSRLSNLMRGTTANSNTLILEQLDKVNAASYDLIRTLLVEYPSRITVGMFKANARTGIDTTKAATRFFRAGGLAKVAAGATIAALIGGSIGAAINKASSPTATGDRGVVPGAVIGAGLYAASRVGLVNRFTSQVGTKLLRRIPRSGLGFAIGIATLQAYIQTDSNSGYSYGMDQDLIQRALVVGTYGIGVGAIYNKFFNIGDGYQQTTNKYIDVIKQRQTIANKSYRGVRDRVKDFFLSMQEFSLSRDVDTILGAIRTTNKGTSIAMDNIGEYIKARDVNQASDLARLVRDGSDDTSNIVKQITRSERRGMGSKTMVRLASNRVTKVLVASAILGFGLHVLTNTISDGNRDRLINDYYNNLEGDSRDPLRIIKGAIADLTRLVTGYDASTRPDHMPRYIRDVYRDQRDSGGMSQLVTTRKLVNSRNDRYKNLNKSWENITSLFVIDDPNPFISFGPVGMTIRSGELNDRYSGYVQLQGAGSDISTATYSMASAFAFKNMMSGEMQMLMGQIAAMRPIDSRISEGNQVSQLAMRQAAIGLLTLTARSQPLRKARQYTKPTEQVLSMIGKDPGLVRALSYRDTKARHMAHQSVLGLMSGMMTDALYNGRSNLTSTLIASLNTDSVEALLNDPFGLITKNPIINALTFYTRGTRNAPKSQTRNPQSYQEIEDVYSIDEDVRQAKEPNVLMAAISNFFNSATGLLPSPLNAIAGIGITSYIGIQTLFTIGTFSNRRDALRVEEDIQDFFSRWYDVSDAGDSYSGRTFGVVRVKDPMGSSIQAYGRDKYLIRKGASYYEMNNLLGVRDKWRSFGRDVNNALTELQAKLNTFNSSAMGGVNLRTRLDKETSNTIEQIRSMGPVSDATKTRGLIQERLMFTMDEYVDSYIKTLESVSIKLPGSVATDIGQTSINLLGLFSKEGTSIDSIKGISSVDQLIPHHQSGAIYNKGYKNSLMNEIQQIVESVINTEIEVGADGVLRLRSGLIVSEAEVLEQLNTKILHRLSNSPDSPLYRMRHGMGGIASTSSKDIITNVKDRVISIVTLEGERKALSDTRRQLGRLVGTDVIDDIPFSPREARDPVFRAEMEAKRRSIRDARTAQDKVVKYNAAMSAVDEVALGSTDIMEAKARATAIKRAKYGKLTSTAMKGVNTMLGTAGLVFNVVEAVDVFSGASRLGASYDDSTTRAQRALIAEDFGGTLVNAGLGASMGVVIPTISSIGAWALGTKAVTATLGGLGALGAAGGAVAAVLGSPIVLGALVVGTVIAAGVAAYNFLLPEDTKEAIGKGVEDAYVGTRRFIGSVFQGIGDTTESILGRRAASAITMGLGAGIGGLLLGAAIAAIAPVSVPVLTIGAIAAGVGALMGLVSGKGTSNITQGVVDLFSQIPIIGSAFTKPGESLAGHMKSQERYSPMMVATAQESIERQMARRMKAAEDPTGQATSSIYITEGISNQAVTMAEPKSQRLALRDIRPGSVMDSHISSAINYKSRYVNQTVLGRQAWRALVNTASNSREIRRLESDMKMINAQGYRQALNNIEMMKSTAAKPVAYNRDKARNTIALAKEITDHSLLVAKEHTATLMGARVDIKVSNDKPSTLSMTKALGLTPIIKDRVDVESINGSSVILNRSIDSEATQAYTASKA